MSGSVKVGGKVRMIRELRKLAVGEVAERSGLAREEVEEIERGASLPSLAPLMKIARALGTRIGTFLDDHEEIGPVVARAGDPGEAIRFAGTAKGAGALRFHPLAADKAGRHMEPFIVDIAPESATEARATAASGHEGEEFIFVLAGRVEVAYGKDLLLLGAGDSIYYDSIVPHAVRCAPGEAAAARILACVYAPY